MQVASDTENAGVCYLSGTQNIPFRPQVQGLSDLWRSWGSFSCSEQGQFQMFWAFSSWVL